MRRINTMNGWLRLLMIVGALGLNSPSSPAEEQGSAATAAPEDGSRPLSIEEFITLATQHDTVFETILIDQLALKYRKNLYLPAKDLVLSVKGQYDFLLNGSREEPEATFSLDKLFPMSGTDLSASYKRTPSISTDSVSSEVAFLISQPIAENAFGRGTRLLDKILGVEIDVIRYQIVEAYEDYLASLIDVYYDWYAAYENVRVGRTSYEQNRKLLDNIYERQRQKIALPVDVNKVKLLVINKEEELIRLEERYKELTNLVYKAVRQDRTEPLHPVDPSGHRPCTIDFDRDYAAFTQSSRTYAILDLLERKSSLDVKKNADDLLPSTNLLLGYKVAGSQWGIKNEDNMAYAGLSISWPFPDQVERAEYETARIDLRKTALTNQNKYLQLYTDLGNIHLAIGREQQLIKLANEKITLAQEVLADEAENYSYGKITLNDYIDAVNRVDTNKFNKITQTIELKKLETEWLRLTDRLVDEKALTQNPP